MKSAIRDSSKVLSKIDLKEIKANYSIKGRKLKVGDKVYYGFVDTCPGNKKLKCMKLISFVLEEDGYLYELQKKIK